ncbi:unnamed protein product [Amaranthus hypochondriacus]
MFPYQNSNDEYFQTTDYVEQQENEVENQNNQVDSGLGGAEGRSRRGRARGRGRGQSSTIDPNYNNAIDASGPSNYNDDDDDQKKSAHRELERQRRQEMSNLYSSLRSELPDEYIRGRRSASDHIAQAVNYIKDLEKNVKDLSNRRDELKASPEWANPSYHVGGSSNPAPRPGSVMINPRVGGLSIDIDVAYSDDNFSLSTALQLLFEEGLSVSSCTSTKVNDRIVHNIICEVMDISCINFSRLQQRLINLVS